MCRVSVADLGIDDLDGFQLVSLLGLGLGHTLDQHQDLFEDM